MRYHPRRLVVFVALATMAAGCGSRHTEAELLAAAGGTGGGARPGSASTGGAAVGAGGGAGASVPGGPAAAGGTAASPSDAGAGGDGAAGAGAGGEGSETPAANGAPITIGVVGTLSGAAGASLGTLAEGVRLWTTWVNDNGGVAGHPIQVVVGDDGGDPARHQALVQEFVEQRGVVAFVGNPEALTGAGSVGYLTQQGVPVIGSDAAGGWFYESPVYFPQGSHGGALLQSTAAGAAAFLLPRGISRVGSITCVEAQVCRDSYNRSSAIMAAHGMQMVYRAQASLGQPDFTAECLSARDAGVQYLSIGMDAEAIRKIAQACARLGFRPVFGWTAGSATAAHAEDPNLQGSLVLSIVGPWTGRGTANLDEFHLALETLAPGTTPSGGHMMGWASAKIFELAVTRAADPTNRASLLEALGGLNGDVLPDLVGPLQYRPGETALPTVCSFGVTIDGNAFVPTEGGRRVCADFDPNL